MEYKILRNRYSTELDIVVNGLLAKGWTLVGGASYTGEAFVQAMIGHDVVIDEAIVKPVIKKPSPQKKSRVKAGGTANVKDA